MATDHDIEQFISDSFASIWDLELLSVVLENPERVHTEADLVERMRSSELIVEQGVRSLAAAGLGAVDAERRFRFQPVNATVAECAKLACEFYARFPGRVRRLVIARQSPGLAAFADAFRLRKDRP